jgi:translocator protein
MERRHWIGLIGWIALCFGVALGAGQFSPGPWYAQLERPVWTPPDRVFGPVWTLLYALMGGAAWLVWKEKGFIGARVALGLFGVQLALNFAWSWLFFGLQSPALALLDIVALWVVIVGTLGAFWRVRPLAGGLLVPYLLWVTLAAALNFEFWRLN